MSFSQFQFQSLSVQSFEFSMVVEPQSLMGFESRVLGRANLGEALKQPSKR